ncbi:MAG: pyridoxal phosphate-dependent aminotransferase [Candidatus Pacebacteria bacterium]|nr:pyridoxal phosphate-dependent aminotransferase [Candidatus Paceibacterota bacterium]
MKTSYRAQQIEPSPTLLLNALVTKLIANGQSVINLTSGQLDTPTPENIKNAAIKAIKDNKTRYTATEGISELREVIAKKFSMQNKIITTPEQVVVGVGAKQLIFNALQVICNPKDEVILGTPTWSTYVEQIKLSGAKPVLVSLSSPFVLTSSDIEKKITLRTKAIILNSPANPTGAVIGKSELTRIAELVIKHEIYIISDEIYESILFGKKHHSIASLSAKVAKQTITINGVSKSYSMTGWRVGYATGPREVIKKMVSLQSQTTSNTSSISQYAALEALNGKQESVIKTVQSLAKRRSYLINELNKITEVSFVEPQGAFYFFVNISNLLGDRYKTSQDWCQELLSKENVAVVPGEAFMAPGYFRLSFAASLPELEEAMKRIRRFVQYV